MYETLLGLDQIRINFSSSGSFLLNIILAFIMFGVALGIRPREFTNVIQKPKALLAGLTAQIFLLPALTFLIITLLHQYITPTVAMGMILVAACPGGNISNFISSLAKGKVELSITMTAFTTLGAILTTPFNFAFWGGLYVRSLAKRSTELLQPIEIDSIQMFQTVFILLGIPLILGLLCTHFLPVISKKMAPWLQRFSIVFFLLMIVVAFSNNLDLFLNHIHYIFVLVLIHNLLALATGFGVGTLFGVTRNERRAITVETGIQNSGLGLALLFNPKIFPQEMAIGGMLMITAWWGIWHIVSGLTLGGLWNRKSLS